MTDLRILLDGLAAQVGGLAWSWVGPTPERDSVTAGILENIGLDARGCDHEFSPLSAADASIWLTLFATRSLLHGERSGFPAALQLEIASALATLGQDATYLARGEWQFTRRGKNYEAVRSDNDWARRRHHVYFSSNSTPLSPINVVMDGGLVGFNSKTSFVFWVAEDD